MKKIKSILAFVLALLMLSSCAVKQNGSTGSNSESSDFIGQTAVMDEAYKELTKDTKTITVDGVLYRNKFQGDLILRNPKYGAEPVLSDSTYSDNTATVKDKVDMTAVYVLGHDGLYEELAESYKSVIEKETFNIYSSDSQYDELQAEYGYSDDNPYKPENATRNRLIYLFFMPLVRILEFIVKKSARIICYLT